MYREYYQFKAMPFAQNFDLNSIFLSQNFEIPLAVLVSGLDKGVKLHAVLGEDGVGKTTFINYVHKHIQCGCTAALINKNFQSPSRLLQFVLSSFGQKTKKFNISGILEQLRTTLENDFEKNSEQPSLLIIDNAHEMASETLKVIEPLIKLNRNNSPLLQLILVGNNDLKETLCSYQRNVMSEKIEILWHHLQPLTYQETINYIQHRLKAAGATAENLFNEQTYSAIHEHSKGIPRNINSLCHQLLLLGRTQPLHQISSIQIPEISDDEKQTGKSLSGSSNSAGHNSFWFFKEASWLTGVIGAGMVIGLFFILNPFFTSPKHESQVIASYQTVKKSKNSKQERVAAALVETERSNRFSVSDNKQQVSISTTAPAKDQQVEKLLAVAEQQLSKSKLLTPKQDNAYETYMAILSANPDEKRAISGLDKIANRYQTLAETKINQGELLRSKTLINRGLKVSPAHTKLTALGKQIEDQLKIQEQQRLQIQTLENQVNQQMAVLKLISPQGDNAYQSNLKVLAIEKTNQQAQQNISKIQRLLMSQIQQALSNNNYGLAMKMVKQILLTPSKENHFQDALAFAYETEKIIKDKISNLLAQADLQMQSKQFAHPAGSNAIETFQKVLRIDRDNIAAKRGLDNLIKQYRSLVERAVSDGKTKQALIYANEAVKAFPDNVKLLELKNSTALALSKQSLRAVANKTTEKRSETKKQLRPFGNF